MSESTLVKIPHCWKSHVAAHIVRSGNVKILHRIHWQLVAHNGNTDKDDPCHCEACWELSVTWKLDGWTKITKIAVLKTLVC